LKSLDGIPGVVPGLVPGIQGWKSPGFLGKTWDQVKSLKFILIDTFSYFSMKSIEKVVSLFSAE
jgi:hypothetical protein